MVVVLQQDMRYKMMKSGQNYYQKNFQTNGFPNGHFILSKVANDGFKLASYANEKKLKKVSILHY